MSESSEVVNEVVDSRRNVYGSVTNSFPRVAAMMSAVLNHEVQAWEVPLLLICLKMIRTAETPTYSDNSDDIEGYLAIFRELIGDDMVHARSVGEYLEKLAAKRTPVARAEGIDFGSAMGHPGGTYGV